MELIDKNSGTVIKKGDIVKYNGELYLASDSADNDGDIEVVNADQDVFYIDESRLTKVYSADGKQATPTVTIEMTVDELKVILADMGINDSERTVAGLKLLGYAEDLEELSFEIYKTLKDILEEVAK